MTTYKGVIINKRDVRVSGTVPTTILGTVAGGALGGVLANQIGGGVGRTVATIGGSVVGATAGSLIGSALPAQKAIEYTVQLSSSPDKYLTVVQGLDQNLAVGQYVFVQVSKLGRSHVIPSAPNPE